MGRPDPAAPVKAADIPDLRVLKYADRWKHASGFDRAFGRAPGVVLSLMIEGVPEKLALYKVERLTDRGLLEYGTSPYHAWPTEKGAAILAESESEVAPHTTPGGQQ